MLRLFLLLVLAQLAAAAVPARAASSLDESAREGSVLFDGAGRYAAAVSPAATPEDRAKLLADFKKQIVMNDHGDPAERAALDSMLARMMDSPTAREVAEKFVEEGARVEISLENIPGSTVATVEGKKTLWGTRGFTETWKVPPRVVLNKFFVENEKDFGIGTLAHETLGHAFEAQRAGPELGGLYLYNTDEEENARMIGWLVRTELEVKPEAEIWRYMESPEANAESLKMASVYYALTLTSEEMKDPVPAYEKRLADAGKALTQLNGRIEKYEDWKKIIAHLVNDHKMDSASFQSRRDDVENALKGIPKSQKNYTDIKTALHDRLAYFATDKGKQYLLALAAASESEYFKRKDAVILDRRERLSGLLIGKPQESTAPPPLAGQITWQQLADLAKKDKESCSLGGVR